MRRPSAFRNALLLILASHRRAIDWSGFTFRNLLQSRLSLQTILECGVYE
jgi:hypothetical protein